MDRTCSIYGGNAKCIQPQGKKPLGRPRCKWKNNIKTDLRETGCEGVERGKLPLDRVQWWAFVDITEVLQLTKLTEIDEMYKAQSSPFCSTLPSPLSSTIFHVIVFLSTLFSNTCISFFLQSDKYMCFTLSHNFLVNIFVFATGRRCLIGLHQSSYSFFRCFMYLKVFFMYSLIQFYVSLYLCFLS